MIISTVLFLVGLYFTGVGVFAIYQNKINKLVEVKLEVISFKIQEDHESTEIRVPVYRIFSGEYQGITKVSIYDEENFTKKLKIGDLIDGFISLPSKDLVSKDSLAMKKWMPIWSLIIGIGVLIASVYFYLDR